jgi:hypothetical protein
VKFERAAARLLGGYGFQWLPEILAYDQGATVHCISPRAALKVTRSSAEQTN